MATKGWSGLSDVVRRGKLRRRVSGVGVRKFGATRFDMELLEAVDAASAREVPLALVIPLPAADTPVALGAASLVAQIVRTGSLDVTATVVSKRLSQRAAYDRLYIDSQRLADFIPRARLTTDGKVEVVGGPVRDRAGRLVLTSDIDRVSGRGALVIDGTAADVGDLEPRLRQCGDLVYITDTPFDSNLDAIREAGGVVWAFDPPSFTDLAAPFNPSEATGEFAASSELLHVTALASRVVRAPEAATSLDQALSGTWKALGRLAAVTGGSENLAMTHAVRWAWGVLSTFSLSVTTPSSYDACVQRGPFSVLLGDATSHARAVSRQSAGPTRDAWAMVADGFADIYEAARERPKFALVQDWVREEAGQRGTGMVVTRNQSAVAALTADLNESPLVPHGWAERIQVVSVRDLACGRVSGLPVSSMLITGPLPRAYASLLAAPAATRLLVTAAGEWEAGRAARQARTTFLALAELRAKTATESAVRLGTHPIVVRPAGPDIVVRLDTTVVKGTDVARGVNDSPWEPFGLDVLKVLARTGAVGSDAAETPPPARGGDGDSSARVDAITVEFADGRAMLMDPNDVVYRKRQKNTRQVAAKSLQTGDVVALVDAAARRNLFDSIIDVLSELPTYAPLAALITFWHERVARVSYSGWTYREILAAMRRNADPTTITSEQTIGTWVRGNSEGPEDAADVRRFAEAVGDTELLRRAGPVGKALCTSRTIHRTVGRWLSGQITGARMDDHDALIDPALGIHVADLLEAVTLHRVTAVQAKLARVPASAIGVLIEQSAIPGLTALQLARGDRALI
ncbi:DISARM anti-phage system protein DrmE domain-containing protein [Streptomyces mirabilis]